jgi:DNA primase
MSDQVDEVKSKVDIVDVIREHVTLKKAGRNFKGLCPFHNEKTPSFMVSPELQIFKCFGCGEAGDVISFLQKYEGLEFYEALKILADRAGVKLKPISSKDFSEKELIIKANNLASKFYNFILLKHPAGKPFLDYLLKKRGLSMETIKTFQLGAAPDRQSLLFNFLAKDRGLNPAILEKSGLVIRARGGYIDRFRGRVIFPINSYQGEVIALAGRILPSLEAKSLAKYINSPETLVYHKSSSLYGLNITKNDIREKKEVIVVEGELDLISSWQIEVRNVVAIKGSALTEEQVRVLSRFAKKFILALDSDFAGDNAAIRGISQVQALGIEVEVARLEKYKDPDDFARGDPEGFKKVLSQPIGIWDFIIDVIFSRNNPKTGSGKAKISHELAPILAGISDKIVQAHYIKLVSERLDVPVEATADQVSSYRQEVEKKPEIYFSEDKNKENTKEILEEQFLSIAFQNGFFELLVKNESVLSTPLAKRIILEFKKSGLKEGKIDIAQFSEKLPEELSQGFNNLFLKELDIKDQNAKKEFLSIVKRLKLFSLNQRMLELAKLISKLEAQKDKKALSKAKKEFASLGRQRAKLE